MSGGGANISGCWRRQTLLTKLIIVNLGIFLTIRIIGVAAMIGGWDIDRVIDMLALPSSPEMLLRRAWTPLTYMFTQYDVIHILFNMLALYWFGTLFLIRCSQKQLMAMYVYGGLAGGLMYIGVAQIFPAVRGTLIGSSASVMAIMTGIAAIMPDFETRLGFICTMKLKWVAAIAVALFALGLVGNNAGGHVAHVGGMIAGLWFGLMLRRGVDITAPINHSIDKIVNFLRGVSYTLKPKKRLRPLRRSHPDGSHRNTPADDMDSLDEILDKIKKSGYTALTSEEKQRLFEVSRRVK